MDYPDGYTHITGNTSSFTHEELYNGMITRNEHLIGFIDEPSIYSDIFIPPQFFLLLLICWF